MAKELKEIREKQEALLAQSREQLNKATQDEARAAEYEQAHDTAMAEYDRLEERARRMIKQAETEARFKERMEANKDKRPKYENTEERGTGEGGDDKPEYRSVFAKIVSGLSPSELEPEERAVLRTGYAEIEKRMQVASAGASGGYVVPTTMADFIDKAMKANGPMYDQDICTVLNHGSGAEFQLPTVDDTAKSAGAHTEGDALADDGSEDVTLSRKSLKAYAYDTEFIKWSWILDMDGIVDMEQLLGELIGERLGRTTNAQLTNGAGGGNAPNGIVTASSLGVTTASALGFTFDEIIDLEHSVNPAYRKSPKAAYMLSDAALKAARKLKNAQNDYIWQAGNVVTGAPALLNGYKYHINDDMAGVATGNKAMIFGDFSKYYVRKVGSYVIAVLLERFWPAKAIAGLVRIDGTLSQAGAVKHLKLA